MMLHCSKCKGTFETEPNPHKDVVFCPHCGGPLQIRGGAGGGGGHHGGGSAAVVADVQSLAALAGGLTGGGGAPAAAKSHGAASAGADPLAALTSATQARSGFGGPPRRVGRVRKKKQGSGNGLLIAILVGAGLLVVAVVIGCVVLMTRPPEAAPVKRVIQPGELFPKKAPESREPGAESPPPG